MSVVCSAEVCRRFLWEGETLSKPFELTDRHQLSALSPQAPDLLLRDSVRHPDGCTTVVLVHSGESLGPGLIAKVLRDLDLT